MTDDADTAEDRRQRLERQREQHLLAAREAEDKARLTDRQIMELYLDERSGDAATAGEATSAETPSAELKAIRDEQRAVSQSLQAIHQALDGGGETQRQLIAHMDQTIGALAGELSALAAAARAEFAQAAAARVSRQDEQRRQMEAQHQALEQQQERLAGWQRAVFGESLGVDAATAPLRQQLLDAVLDGNPAAVNLAGWLLLVQAAAADRVAGLLQDLGEAYYAWRPKTGAAADPLEQAIVALAQQRCEALGTGNRIELVRPGDRFDNGCHDSKERGASVTAVHGWIVLRNNGKVYTRARVSVQ